MADVVVAKSGRPSVCSILPDAMVTGLVAGAAIDYGDTVYIASTGKVLPTDGTAADVKARYRGVCPGKHASGDKDVTVYFGEVTFQYGSGLTPGADYYLSATVGALSTGTTTGGTTPVAFAVDTSRIRFLSPK